VEVELGDLKSMRREMTLLCRISFPSAKSKLGVSRSMKIAIVGAGGLGGFLEAKFAASEMDATLIAREPSLSAIRLNGIVLNTPGGRVSANNVSATDNPAQVGPVDFVIFAVKLWDTEAAACNILPLLGPNTALISFQNGVHKDELIGKILGRERVLGGIAEISVRRESPGIIHLTSEKHRFVVGSYSGRDSDSARGFAEVMKSGGINCVVSNNIESELWEEYALVVGVSAMTAACLSPSIQKSNDSQQPIRAALKINKFACVTCGCCTAT
jgi:2-dehydropantoate 2-reductase